MADRVRFMGYVPDDELETVLAATDVALCPFREMSASGALATWISAGRPIVTSDLPPIRELDALAPGAVACSPRTSRSRCEQRSSRPSARPTAHGPAGAATGAPARDAARSRTATRRLYRAAAALNGSRQRRAAAIRGGRSGPRRAAGRRPS